MISDSEPAVVVAGDALIDLTPTRTVRGLHARVSQLRPQHFAKGIAG